VSIVHDPNRYLMTTDWVSQVGVPLLTFLEPTAVGNQTERRVMFAGACDVDFSFIPVQQMAEWRHHGMPDEVALVAQRGTRILFDKDGAFTELLRELPPRPQPRTNPPSALVFTEAVNDFLYHAVWCAKKLYRGERWLAKQACDGYLKQQLLRMMEWHAQAQHQWQLDTWHAGRFLEQWASPEALAGLPKTFAHYTAEDIQRALLATLDLYRQLAVTVAVSLNYAYPDETHHFVATWIQEHSPTGVTNAGPRLTTE
jgi:aminoglycoside 6-adenylyltransferase